MDRRLFFLPNPPKSPKPFAVWIVLLPFLAIHDGLLFYSRRTEAKKRSKKLNKERKRDAPPPLNLKRKGAFSSLQVNASSDVRCPLLTRLPKEIRLQIWQYAMDSGGRHYHLMHGDGRLAHAICQSGTHDSLNDLPTPCCLSMASRSCCPQTHISYACFPNSGCVIEIMAIHNMGNPWGRKMRRADLALLRTCRQIYQEAAELPYSTNIIDVDDLATLIYWSRTILPSRLTAVRNLKVDWEVFWPPLTKSDPSGNHTYKTACAYERIRIKHSDKVWLEFWNTVATEMKGLRDLRVTIGFLSGYIGIVDLETVFGIDRGLVRSIDALWLKPILQIRGLRRFELEIRDYSKIYRWVAPSDEHDQELKDRTGRLLQDVRQIVCMPTLS